MVGQPPGAQLGHRAPGALRPGGGADQGAELHHRDRPRGRGRLVLREQVRRECTLGGSDRASRELDAGDGPGEHPADVGVEHDVPATVGEGGDGGRGVVAHTRQVDQLFVGGRHLAPMAVHHRHGRCVQAQRAPRVAEAPPHPDRLARALRRQVRGSRPALQPGRVHRQHPGDRRLLEHELRDHHRPRRGRRAAPGQVAGVVGVPGEDGFPELHGPIVSREARTEWHPHLTEPPG
jgi:hypothetical protein